MTWGELVGRTRQAPLRLPERRKDRQVVNANAPTVDLTPHAPVPTGMDALLSGQAIPRVGERVDPYDSICDGG